MQLEHLLVQGLSVNQSASNPLELTDVLEKILSFLDDDSLNKASAVCRCVLSCPASALKLQEAVQKVIHLGSYRTPHSKFFSILQALAPLPAN